jgi:ribosomal protein S18 acetylase RimI-like enzyme
MIIVPLGQPPLAVGLRRLVDEFDCSSIYPDDEIAVEVDRFLRHGMVRDLRYRTSSTFVALSERSEHADLMGYVTVCLGSIQLTEPERDDVGAPPFISSFGAIKIAMLGVDRRHRHKGVGEALVDYVVARSRRVADLFAVRFVCADVNPNVIDWYAQQDFVACEKGHRRGTTSMRLDLLKRDEIEALHRQHADELAT